MNGYHDNSPNEQRTTPTALATTRERKVGASSAWRLRELLRPLSRRRAPRTVTRFVELPHYAKIIRFLWQHRYATGEQVREMFPNIYDSPRTCGYQLKRLTDAGYLGVVPVSSTSPNFPLVYYATRKGLAYLRSAYPNDRELADAVATERFRVSSRDFILHELLTTQLDIAIRRSAETSPHVEILEHERRYFRPDKQLRYMRVGKRLHVAPDSGFVIRANSPDKPTGSALVHFIEIDNGSMSFARLQRKFANYVDWFECDGRAYLNQCYRRHDKRTHDRPTFRLLVLAHAKNAHEDERRLQRIHDSLADMPRWFKKVTWITTAQSLESCRQTNVITAPIWRRTSDDETNQDRRPLFDGGVNRD